MDVRSGVVVAVLASCLVGGNAAAETPQWVVLNISRVQVSPAKLDGTTWDGPAESKKAGACGIVGLVGKAAAVAIGAPGLANAGGAVVTYLCSRSASGQAQRNPSAPDLFVQVVAGDAVFRTPIASNTFSEVFDFAVVVPLEGIPSAGMQVQVLDQDDDVSAGELIGMARLTKKQVVEALAASPPLMVLSDSQVARLEIEVTPYSSPSAVTATFAVDQEPISVPIKARAGERVTITARGEYSVADSHEQLDELGYTNGKKRSYNRKEFPAANHAAAVAFIGPPAETHTALVVGSCIADVAPVAGQIFVGVNDASVGNNKGAVAFDVTVSAPTIEQWRAGGAYRCGVAKRPEAKVRPAEVASSGGGLPLECLEYKAAMERLEACDKLPQATRAAIRQSYEQAAATWANVPEEGRGALRTACKAAASAVQQSAASCGNGDHIDEVLADMSTFKERMCGCTNKACVDKVQDAWVAYGQSRKDTLGTPSDAQARRLRELDDDMRSCRHRYTSEVTNAIAKMRAFADSMCACHSSSCVRDVLAQMTAWSDWMSKNASKDEQPTKAERAAMEAATTRITDCMNTP